MRVTGVDNLNDYYNPELKYARLKECGIDRTEIAEMKPVRAGKFQASPS